MVPKINVYLPDDLAAAVRDANVPVSAVCQSALERAVREVTALREVTGVPSAGATSTATTGAGWIDRTFARHTPRARQALVFARQEAVKASHHAVGTEHLLLGILQEADNLGLKMIAALDVDASDLERELSGSMAPAGGGATPTELPLTPHLGTALGLAFQESLKLGHNYVGCEHLLLGLVAEPDGLAGSVLRQLGLELRITRRAVVTALTGFLHAQRNAPAEPPKPAVDNTLQQILERLDAIERRLAG
jgi:ATP-dependent Clp protease ATP-binding subunit ClpA/post-segregation antitoxin (ccd killing protein)